MTSVDIEKAKLSNVPKWIIECLSLKSLDLDRNMIKTIKSSQLPPSLVDLTAKGNLLEEVDL